MRKLCGNIRKYRSNYFREFCRIPQKKIRTVQNFKFVYQNNFLYQHSTLKTQKTTVTFSPNNDLVIQNFDFELIIGYFELSKSQFKAFNLPQDIFQDKISKFQVIKV